MSATSALVRLELRQALPVAAASAGVLALSPAVPAILSPEFVQHAYPTISLLLGVPLAACSLGGSAIAGERAAGTWSFLKARAIGERRIVAVKLAVRGALAAAVLVATVAAVAAWTGGLRWLELADLPFALGLRLSVLLGVAAFLLAFAAGDRLDDATVASLGGLVAAGMLVVILLLPGAALGGSAREALTLDPGSWISARRILAGRGLIGSPAQVSPSGDALAFAVSDGKETSRVAVVALERRGETTFVPIPTLLPRGTELVGWQDAASLRVRWPGGEERIVLLDGSTRPAAAGEAIPSALLLKPEGGTLLLGTTPVYPRPFGGIAP